VPLVIDGTFETLRGASGAVSRYAPVPATE